MWVLFLLLSFLNFTRFTYTCTVFNVLDFLSPPPRYLRCVRTCVTVHYDGGRRYDATNVSFYDQATWIRPGLWFGPMPSQDWDFSANDVHLVVSVADEPSPQAPRHYEWGTPGGNNIDSGLMFMHWPIADGDLPDRTLLNFMVNTIVTAVESNLGVYVHCAEGRNRSALIAGLAYQKLDELSGGQVLERLRSVRTGVLGNRAFADIFTDSV